MGENIYLIIKGLSIDVVKDINVSGFFRSGSLTLKWFSESDAMLESKHFNILK